MRKTILISGMIFLFFAAYAQEEKTDTATAYKKRVLENAEVDFLMSYYNQDGNNAAVSGGIGTEKLNDATPTIVIAVPLNDDDVLTIDGGISAYTSASSSNINPFDGRNPADPFVASSGASRDDVWANFVGSYSHSSDDRNTIWSGKMSASAEFDYYSFGLGGGYTKLFNEKNTEFSLHANVYLDTWDAVYPYELRPFAQGGSGLNDRLFSTYSITGNTDYNPVFSKFDKQGRNSYSLELAFSQILTKRMQGLLVLDVVQQRGLLSTPFQRVYFSDVADSYIENFHLADAIEKMPDTRFKIATGARLNLYVNEHVVVRTFYRYYTDDWGIKSHTASIEIPVKIGFKWTVYPSYRFYFQTASDYFAPYEQHLSTEQYYTSDYDLSGFNANQFGFGITYTDILTEKHLWKFGLKSVDLKFNKYDRNTGLSSFIVSGGVKFILDYKLSVLKWW